jgi:hypothetical protein
MKYCILKDETPLKNQTRKQEEIQEMLDLRMKHH